jgi:hypothetical protein
MWVWSHSSLQHVDLKNTIWILDRLITIQFKIYYSILIEEKQNKYLIQLNFIKYRFVGAGDVTRAGAAQK